MDSPPLFPIVLPGLVYNDGSTERPEVHERGMTLRQYFAATAPANVPEWFKHKHAPRPKVPSGDVFVPVHLAGRAPELQSLADAWRGDPCYDLRQVEGLWTEEELDALEEYEGRWTRYWEERDYWRGDDERARYFQWRWYYADRMVELSTCDEVLPSPPAKS